MPILLALGIGVMRSQRQKRLATAALEQSVAAGAGQVRQAARTPDGRWRGAGPCCVDDPPWRSEGAT